MTAYNSYLDRILRIHALGNSNRRRSCSTGADSDWIRRQKRCAFCFDPEIIPHCMRGVVVGARITAKLKDDSRERELDFSALNSIEEQLHRFAVRDHAHPVQAAVIERGAIEQCDIRPAARGHVAVFPNLAIVAPAAL